jgi:glutathione-regulated potassium-efflux system protein KefB
MTSITLGQVGLFLAAAAIAAPLAKALRIGTVLGYLFAGLLIGPYGLGRLTGVGVGDAQSAEAVLHFAEFGVVLLLFLIGLELRLNRLWAMRVAIFGAGALQVLATGVALGLIGAWLGLSLPSALFFGLALSLSSTAFALQVMEENGELTQRHGRLGFAILLFQDLAAIPLLALASLYAASQMPSGAAFDALGVVRALGVVAVVVLAGRYLIDTLFRLVAATQLHEAMTAAALLVVVVVVLIMEAAGLSASLGAFIAGVLLADSAFRHEIEADIKPFEGLLLGLFFTAIGMSLDVSLVAAKLLHVVALVAGLLLVKTLLLYLIGRLQRLQARPSLRMALSLSQGGEFAFVLLGAGAAARLLTAEQAALGAVLVTVSMLATPLLLALETRLAPAAPAPPPAYDTPPEAEGHVIVAGFGRFGQIVSRVLRAKRIPFTALDIDAGLIGTVARFGAKAYYGDASRLEILEAAQAGKARAIVLAIDDVEASVRTAETLKRHFPSLPVFARARNRNHVHQLMHAGVTIIERETFRSALATTHTLLRALGVAEAEARRAIALFELQDARRLAEDFSHAEDQVKIAQRARAYAEELEQQLAADAAEQAVAEGQASPAPRKPAAAAVKA